VTAQGGLDVLLSRHWVLNADVRYLGGLEVNYSGTGYLQQLSIDPFLFGVGVAFRFASSP
jgi:outer membrane protein W